MSEIKSRLKAAYDNVEFYANSTWVHNSHAYQRANQELFVRECKVRDAIVEEPTRPRTVQDSIPQSRLAQYSNYEYNESRELCYASNATNITFYYPCVYKRNSIKEPWMIPEIEQLFIWFSYAPDFNILELLRLEELSHLDEQEKLKVGRRPSCCWHDFHEIYPVFYETLERTPGKSRYTSCPPVTRTDLSKFIPTQLKILTFEDMILRMKIKSDKVKYLWCQHSQPKSDSLIKEAKLNILKSPLGNYFILEDTRDATKEHQEQKLLSKRNWKVDDHNLKRADFGQLQYLADSIRTLETLILNSTRNAIGTVSSSETCIDGEVPSINISKVEAPPARRLYSAVLQGLKTDTKPSSSTDVTPLSTSPTKEPSLQSVSSTSPTKTTTSCYIAESSSGAESPMQKSSPLLPKAQLPCSSGGSASQWVSQSGWDTTSMSTRSYTQLGQENLSPTAPQFSFQNSKPSYSQRNDVNYPVKLASTSSDMAITAFYSDLCAANVINTTPNVSCPPFNLTSAPGYSASSGYLGNTYANNNVCFNNLYGNNNYVNNPYFNCQYTPNFQNSSYTGTSLSNNLYASGMYQSSQVSSMNSRNVLPMFNRQPYPSSQVHLPPTHAMLLFQHSRPSSVAYSVASQPYLVFASSAPPPPPPPPLPRQNQRWIPPTHYVRTSSTMHSYHVPMAPQHVSTPPLAQHWGMQNQNVYRTNSNQQITCASQQFTEPGPSTRTKIKPKKVTPPYVNFSQLKGKTRSPEDSACVGENFDQVEVSSGTYSNLSATYSKMSTGSDIAFSLPSLEKPLPVRSIASTSSLACRKLKSHTDSAGHAEKRASAVVFRNDNENSSYFSSDSEESHTLLPISTTISEDLERQALEQYEHSNENFYRELERQAEEQYDDDHSENWVGPPTQTIYFGGLTICSIWIIIKNYLFIYSGNYVRTGLLLLLLLS